MKALLLITLILIIFSAYRPVIENYSFINPKPDVNISKDDDEEPAKIRIYRPELNIHGHSLGRIEPGYWYLKTTCPDHIKDFYKLKACGEGNCFYFLKCYKRI